MPIGVICKGLGVRLADRGPADAATDVQRKSADLVRIMFERHAYVDELLPRGYIYDESCRPELKENQVQSQQKSTRH
jgi:hypothetical protein